MYLKYLEDNLNDKFANEMAEYKKYIKLFYTHNSKCPVDTKIPLEKKHDKFSFELSCKLKSGKEWKVSIKKPTILNLNIVYNNLTDEFKNKGIIFKNNLKENLLTSTYNPQNDKELEKEFTKLKEYENQLESIKEIFNKEKKMIEDILKERQNILKKLSEINIKKVTVYKKCPQINAEKSKKLKDISINEKEIGEQRLGQIAKNVDLDKTEVKHWIDYFKLVMEYLNENENLNGLNMKMNKLRDKFKVINDNYILQPPTIYMSGEKVAIKMKKQKKSQ